MRRAWHTTVRHFSQGAVLWKGRKRFYKKADVMELGTQSDNAGGRKMFGVGLDGSPLFTPHKQKLQLEWGSLAECLAREWNNQEQHIEPATMPLMTLTCSAIDVTENNKQGIIEELLRFFTTDTLFYFQPDQQKLYEKQKVRWNPIVDEIQAIHGPVALSFTMQAPRHLPETIESIQLRLNALDRFQLTAVESLASGLKSLSLPLALLNQVTRTHRSGLQLGVTDAIEAARLEEEHQIAEWGLVEGGHDVDRANLSVQVAAAMTFLRLTNST